MCPENTWKQYFDTHAGTYEEEIFTKNTAFEIQFLLEELRLPPGNDILDMGCGTGRHSIPLALAGYQVTGVDISAGMLAEARKKASVAGVQVDWVQTDARLYWAEKAYDAAISLCEGALCLHTPEDDPLERDQTVLGNISQALKPGGKLIITVLNASRMIRQVSEEDLEAGLFDLHTLTEPGKLEIETADGTKTILVRERYYTSPELVRMLNAVDIEVEHIWGGTAGVWQRLPIRLEEMEIMVVGSKRFE